MSYTSQILAQNPKAGAAYSKIFDAIRERHFRANPAPDPDTYWRRVLQLSPGERSYLLATWFSEQVHNGGFHQFFSNGGFSRAYPTVTALELFGFVEAAKFLRRAIEVAKIPETLPPGYEFDSEDPEDGSEDLQTRLSVVGSEFYKARTNKDWPDRIVEYVRTHPDEFV